MSNRLAKIFKAVLPAPFTIAVLLTALTFILAYIISPNLEEKNKFIQLLGFWEKGLWDKPLLVFAFQMMLMLILGHVLALTKAVNTIIEKASQHCTTTAKAAAVVTFLTILVSLFNWGLGLIFGAIGARKICEYANKKNMSINYPIVGAAG